MASPDKQQAAWNNLASRCDKNTHKLNCIDDACAALHAAMLEAKAIVPDMEFSSSEEIIGAAAMYFKVMADVAAVWAREEGE